MLTPEHSVFLILQIRTYDATISAYIGSVYTCLLCYCSQASYSQWVDVTACRVIYITLIFLSIRDHRQRWLWCRWSLPLCQYHNNIILVDQLFFSHELFLFDSAMIDRTACSLVWHYPMNSSTEETNYHKTSALTRWRQCCLIHMLLPFVRWFIPQLHHYSLAFCVKVGPHYTSTYFHGWSCSRQIPFYF